jgi:hypothetical protein
MSADSLRVAWFRWYGAFKCLEYSGEISEIRQNRFRSALAKPFGRSRVPDAHERKRQFPGGGNVPRSIADRYDSLESHAISQGRAVDGSADDVGSGHGILRAREDGIVVLDPASDQFQWAEARQHPVANATRHPALGSLRMASGAPGIARKR